MNAELLFTDSWFQDGIRRITGNRVVLVVLRGSEWGQQARRQRASELRRLNNAVIETQWQILLRATLLCHDDAYKWGRWPIPRLHWPGLVGLACNGLLLATDGCPRMTPWISLKKTWNSLRYHFPQTCCQSPLLLHSGIGYAPLPCTFSLAAWIFPNIASRHACSLFVAFAR